jgi:UDP-3-O-[3-hydroxymyristoyl] glucosamine N-acyltransferase
MQLSALAEALGARVEGDGSVEIADLMPLEQATANDLAWLADAKYTSRLATTQAAAVLLDEQTPLPSGLPGIRVADPDLAMCAALRLLGPPPPTVPPGVAGSATVAPDAEIADACVGDRVWIGPGARIGTNTQLHPGVYIGAGAVVGRDCVLWPNVVVRERCELGDRVVVHPNSTIGADGFGYLQRDAGHVKIPQVGRVVIGDDVEIGANTAIDRARSGVTVIGRGTKIDNLVQVGHNVQVGEHCLLVGQAGLSGSTTLGNHVVLAGQAGVTDHVRIGDQVIVGGQSGVTRDLPEPGIYAGTPARQLTEAKRQLIAAQRLPELVAEVRNLRKRVQQLESSADA